MKTIINNIKTDYRNLTETAKRLLTENAPVVLRKWDEDEVDYVCEGKTGPVTFRTYTGYAGPQEYTVNTVTVEDGNIILNCTDQNGYRDYEINEDKYENLPVWINILDEIINLQ